MLHNVAKTFDGSLARFIRKESEQNQSNEFRKSFLNAKPPGQEFILAAFCFTDIWDKLYNGKIVI